MNTSNFIPLAQNTPISVFDLASAIIISFLIGLAIAFVYRFTHRGLNYERSFVVTLVLTGPVVGLVIMLIDSNIALSLGLVGALSIISRFISAPGWPLANRGDPMSEECLRFESKYILDPITFYRLKGVLPKEFALDPLSRSAPQEQYLVRSLYFDTDGYHSYFEKVTREYRRLKIRFRAYGDNPQGIRSVSVEPKHRIGNRIGKISTHADLASCDKFIETSFWPRNSGPVLREVEYHIKRRFLCPKVLVEYRHEAYICRYDQSIRLSFDHGIRYSEASVLFPKQTSFRFDQSRAIVMEEKVFKDDLKIINQLVRDFDLKAVPNSKYVNAIDHSQNNIWH